MGEIHLSAGRHSFADPGFALHVERVPADMRHLHRFRISGRAQPLAGSAHDAEALQLGCLGARLEQPLHPEADAQQRASAGHAVDDRVGPMHVDC